MNSEKPKSLDALNVDPSEAGSLTPDAGFEANAADLNDSSHDFDNVDSPVPDDSRDEGSDSVADRQMGIIGRMSG
jgi:hypothetical protein